MADTKISALTAATTPLAGTEVLPIVQSGVTKQVSIANLTAGRAVAGLSFTANSRTVLGSGGWWDNAASGNNVGMVSGGAKITPSDGSGSVTNNICDFGSTTGQWKNVYAGSSFTVANRTILGAGYLVDNAVNGNNSGIFFGPSYIGPTDGAANATNNVTNLGASSYAWKDFYLAGNVIQKTANKGVNFTANTPAAGMTSQLLNWYEEGIYTPTVTPGTSGSLTLNTANNTLAYTRIGRQVFVTGQIRINTSTSPVGTYADITLPFTVSSLSNSASYSTSYIYTGAAAILAITQPGTTTLRAYVDASTLTGGTYIGLNISYTV